MPASDVIALYKNFQVYLWVEDALTRHYLEAALGPQGTIGLLIAGAGDNLRPLVRNARKEGMPNVFALSDRDFGDSNLSAWASTTEVFRLETHEVENFLLDSAALAASTVNEQQRTQFDLEAKFQSEAAGMVWGMALGATMHWLRGELFQDFPSSGSLASVTSQTEAEQRIFAGPWMSHIAALPQAISQATITQHLQARHGEFQGMLATNEWRKRFGGKEILKRVIGYLAPSANILSKDEAFAKEVGRYHLTNGLPSEIKKLRDVLLAVP